MSPGPQHGRGAGVQLSIFCVCEIALPPRLQLLGSGKVSAWEPGGLARSLGTEVDLVPGAQICCINSGDPGLEFASFLCPCISSQRAQVFPSSLFISNLSVPALSGTFHTPKNMGLLVGQIGILERLSVGHFKNEP